MGSRSSSASSQQTTNQSLTAGISGDNSGLVVTGSNNRVTNYSTDHGAMSTAQGVFDSAASVARDSQTNIADAIRVVRDSNDSARSLARDLAEGSNDLARFAIGEQAATVDGAYRLADSAMYENRTMASDLARQSSDLARFAIGEQAATVDGAYRLADSAMYENRQANTEALALAERVTGKAGDLAQWVAGESLSTARDQVQTNADLARDLASDSQTKLADGFKSILQFADGYSRSDGQALAAGQSEVMKYLVIGAALVGVAFAMKGAR